MSFRLGWCAVVCLGCASAPEASEDGANGTSGGDSLYLRLRNDTALSFDSLTVERTIEYGAVPAGEDTEYLPLEYLYNSLLVEGTSESRTISYTPTDHLGDAQLTDGYYTYVLTVHPENPEWFGIMLLTDPAPE
jgi:hypothetical protein